MDVPHGADVREGAQGLDSDARARLGEKEFRRLSADKKDPYLKALEDEIPSLSLLNRVYVGTFDIPLNMIVGTYSSSRKLSFASNYMPVMEEGSEFSYKWNN